MPENGLPWPYTRPEIIDKLAAELKTTEELTEPRVVYILVQVRKLIESRNEAAQYPFLKLFCDWAVHSKLDRKGASRVIKLFDEFQETAITKSPKEYFEHGERLRGDVLDAEVFRRELQRFFAAVLLPDDLCTKDEQWYSFLGLYGKVIHETPLASSKKNGDTLNAFGTVLFQFSPPPVQVTWMYFQSTRNLGRALPSSHLPDRRFLKFPAELPS